MSFLRCSLILCICLFGTLLSLTSSLKAEARFMRVHGQAAPPFGFVEFCRAHKSECKSRGFETARFQASPRHLSELDEINRYVNAIIAPATDSEVYGIEEYWTFPKSAGDCEDYVVLKRHILMNRGWPASALLITVVIDERGDGHAVLTARTAQGDFILDNQNPDVKLWTATPYRYVMRQSYINPNVWMSLDPRATITSYALGAMAP